jgi:DNA-binding CsgD family transcriptional regulator
MPVPLWTPERLRGLREATARAATLPDLEAVCAQLAQDAGFDHFVFALRLPTHFAKARVVRVDGFPAGWMERYAQRDYYAVDPVVAHCAQQTLPVRWSDLPLLPGTRAQMMMKDAASYGLREGVSMPVHSPAGELGVLSLAIDADPARVRLQTEAALPYVQVAAPHLHAAMRRVAGPPLRPRALSPRETDCLRWAADGKTSAEIGQLLGMAESTVNYHFNNALKKLDVANRQQAVALAALLGLVQPKPF